MITESSETKKESKARELDPLQPLKGTAVAIVGFSESTRHDAPWGDKKGWPELWVCNRLPLQEGVTRWTRHFDPHPLSWTEQNFTSELFAEYLGFLTQDHGDRLIYLLEEIESVPNSVRYPIERVVEFVGRRYFTNVIGYQIALALVLGAKKIGLWGIDLRADEEYGAQRPNVEWLLGVAQGMGVEVELPDKSAVLNADRSQPLYGMEEGGAELAEVERAIVSRVEELQKRLAELAGQNEAVLKQMHTDDGALQESLVWLHRVRMRRRGGIL